LTNANILAKIISSPVQPAPLRLDGATLLPVVKLLLFFFNGSNIIINEKIAQDKK